MKTTQDSDSPNRVLVPSETRENRTFFGVQIGSRKLLQSESSFQTQRTDDGEEVQEFLFFYTDLVQTAESYRVKKFMRRS
ncbi:hypothetical protein ATANTOWER_017374 [Ataeniobius toweri]|uniref:Uncharacterized protein n=1 Tax=Ataeniobius toweri TaxID=208326 RepID=A0ABU7BGJ2_9TELE|nr:hypothetical protein [Ataeniobius toweri]